MNIFFLGFVLGIIIAAAIFIFIMVKYMIVYYRIPGTFEEVNNKVKETIPKFKGWSFPIPSWQFYKSQISKGFTYDNIKNMEIHFVCKPAHANVMLRKRPEFGGIMPCAWAVYEKTDGKVYIAKMNIGLMSMIFPGIVKKIMKDVAGTEAKMLKEIKENQ